MYMQQEKIFCFFFCLFYVFQHDDDDGTRARIEVAALAYKDADSSAIEQIMRYFFIYMCMRSNKYTITNASRNK